MIADSSGSASTNTGSSWISKSDIPPNFEGNYVISDKPLPYRLRRDKPTRRSSTVVAIPLATFNLADLVAPFLSAE